MYDRFRPLNFSEDGKRIEMVGVQVSVLDFVMGICVLSRVKYNQKLKLIYDICDDDGDHCMRPAEILLMLQKLERLFSKETTSVNLCSTLLLFTNADKRAEHKFHFIMAMIKKQ
jgi:hypothetical protein